MKKTNAMRILDGLNIKYEIQEYEADTDHDLPKGAANRTAEELGIEAGSVFKTIVFRTDTKEICVICESAEFEINPKKARTVIGCKEINTVKPEELLSITGYIRGGCSPLGMKKKFRTFIDETAPLYDKIHISAGQRGIQISINPEDLIKATDATLCDLTL